MNSGIAKQNYATLSLEIIEVNKICMEKQPLNNGIEYSIFVDKQLIKKCSSKYLKYIYNAISKIKVAYLLFFSGYFLKRCSQGMIELDIQ